MIYIFDTAPNIKLTATLIKTKNINKEINNAST